MRLALAIAPHDAEPSSFVVFRDHLSVTIPKVAGMGYDGVELALGQRSDVDADEVLRLLSAHGLGVSAVSTGRVFAEQHVWLTSEDAAVQGRAVEILCGLADLAAELGATRVNIGRVRGGIPPGQTPDAAEARFGEGIRRVCDHAAPLGIALVLEPVNRYELDFINSVDPDGIGLVDRVGHPSLKLMPDSFHMNIEDVSIAGSIVSAGHRVGYCQLADSNRWAPGQGHIDFRPIVDALGEIGYDDWVAVEILPFPSPDVAAQQAVMFLRGLLPAYVS